MSRTNQIAEPYRREPFAQDVAYVIVNSFSLTDHVERRLAYMYDISATDAGQEDYHAAAPPIKRDRDGTKRPATHVKMFPGAIVCSLLRSNIGALVDQRNNYVVLEKTDGVRYLLLLTTVNNTPYAILIDRKMEMRIVNVDIPLALYEQEALFDGELAQNVDNGLFTYLIFDLIYTSARNDRGEPLQRDTPYTYRMRRANDLIRGNWHKHLTTEAEYSVYSETSNATSGSNSQAAPRPKNTFAIKVKRYVQLSEFEKTFGDVCQRNVWTYHGFRIDGFIFVRGRQHVEPFRNTRQYKYKPADKHTIDVQLMASPTSAGQYDLLAKNARNCPEKYAWLGLCPPNLAFLERHRKEMERCHRERINFIVECSWDSALRCWILLQPRLDKQVPNALHTIEQTKKNIDENITLAELVQAFRPFVKSTPLQPMMPSPCANITATTNATTVATTNATTNATTTARPFIHPSRQRNFAPIPAGEHQLPWAHRTDLHDDGGCECEYCAGKRANVNVDEKQDLTEAVKDLEPYDPESNWQVETEKETATVKPLTFSDADLEQLLAQMRDPKTRATATAVAAAAAAALATE